MKKIILSICLMSFFSASSFAKSDCVDGEQNCWDCGKTENDLCTARLNTTTKALSITGTGEMRDYVWESGSSPYGIGHTDAPWGYNYTSVSVEGVKNIGESAFVYASVTKVNISDSVNKIGNSAFSSCYSLTNFSIPDSVTTIGEKAFGWAPYYGNNIQNLFIPESVASIASDAFLSSNITTIYCAETTDFPNSGPYRNYTKKTYTKDQNGVYLVDGQYYASPDDMISKSSCGSGEMAPQNCIDAAKAYQAQKAAQMAGGALCQTKDDCLFLINMANKKMCTSIVACKDQITLNSDGSYTIYDKDGNIIGFKGKRIYTVDEATLLAKPQGNTFTLRYR